MPSDSELERDVREALRVANMDEMSLKVIRKQLEVKWQVNFKILAETVIIFCSWSCAQSVPHAQLCTATAVPCYSYDIHQYSLWVQDTYERTYYCCCGTKNK